VKVRGIRVCETKYREKYRILSLKKGPTQYSRGPRCGSAAARLLGLRVRIPPGARMSVTCECCVLSRRGFCGGMIIRPGESYRVLCVFECEREASMMMRLSPPRDCCAVNEKIVGWRWRILLVQWENAYLFSSYGLVRLSLWMYLHLTGQNRN